MINLEILRLEINELLYHIEVFIGNTEKFKAKESLNNILNKYVFIETDDIGNDTDIIKSFIQKLSLFIDTNEYNMLVNNMPILIKFINT